MKSSRGEIKICDILDMAGLRYIEEYSFPDCKNKRVLRFDFCAERSDGKKVLIEVDGEQHFYVNTWATKETLQETQKRDKIKDDYCREHGLILIRIPYWLYRHTTYLNILSQTFFGQSSELA